MRVIMEIMKLNHKAEKLLSWPSGLTNSFHEIYK